MGYAAPPMFEPLQREYSGYIFDCDGTVVDSMGVHHQAWVAALRAHGAEFEFGWELFNSRAGMSLPSTVEALNEQFGLSMDPESVTLHQRRGYESLIETIQPIAPVVELARRVAQTRPVSVASGGDPLVVRRTLELLGLADLFKIVLTAEDVRAGKPAPDMFLLAAERMGVPARECVVFEDGVLGIEAARRAGMDCVRVRPPNAR